MEETMTEDQIKWMHKVARTVIELQKAVKILQEENKSLRDRLGGVETILTQKCGVSNDALGLHQAFTDVSTKDVAKIEYEKTD